MAVLSGMISRMLVLLFTASALLLSACSNQQVEPMLKVGTNQWPGYDLLYLARSLQ